MKENEGRKFVELEWVCPNCQGVNRGSKKTCESCGAPQPPNVQFRRSSKEQIVTDEKLIKAARAGADIHCGYCNARNPAGAETCSQCGADLKEGKRREAGATLEAPKAAKTILCLHCGAENPADARICSKCGAPPALAQPPSAAPHSTRAASASQGKFPWLWVVGGIAAFLLCCAALFALFVFPSKSVQGRVTALEWQTFVPVQEQKPTRHTNEAGSPPADAYDVSCETKSEEVCTTRMVDQGNGFAEEVKECATNETQSCDYTLDEWTTIQTYTLSGTDNAPVYDEPRVYGGQRLGEPSEELKVTFSTPEGIKTYKPSSVEEFRRFEIGGEWTLTFNAVGGILSVER